MSSDFFKLLPPLPPLDFLTVHFEAEKNAHTLLPNTSALCQEERFAEVAFLWNEEKIVVAASIQKPFEECFYPGFQDGDSLELFFDTRDLKTKAFATRYCHHFVFLPQAVNEVQAQEVTRFRGEDSHPLCSSEDLIAYAHFDKKSYRLQAEIPASCLYGYDPAAFDRLGFTYRLNRYKGAPQHFSVSSERYSIEKQPSLWSSIKLLG